MASSTFADFDYILCDNLLGHYSHAYSHLGSKGLGSSLTFAKIF